MVWRTQRGRLARALAVLAGCALVGACATWSPSFQEVEAHLAQQRYPEALIALEKQGDASRQPLLYQLNKGMLLRMAGDYRGSNQAFEAAKKLIEEFSAVSLREQAGTFIINDAVESYAGEEHEHVFVHLYEALNYLALDNLDSARVEALQIDLTLRQQSERAGQKTYMDAFARYLTGMIYEDLGEWSDAMIAYRKSYEAYLKNSELYAVSVPQALKHDLLRLTEHLGLKDELHKYKKTFAVDKWAPLKRRDDHGEFVFLLHNGLAPVKREQAASMLDPLSGHVVRIALPYYEPRVPPVRAARLTIAERTATTEMMEDVGAVAKRTLEAKLPAVTARAIARAVVKAELAKAAREQARRQRNSNDGFAALMIGFGVEMATVLTERADTRSWATLPHDIQLGRITVPPGRYTIKIELLGTGNTSIGNFEMHDVVIRPGRKTFISRHWLASQSMTLGRAP